MIRKIDEESLDQLLLLYKELADGTELKVSISHKVFQKINSNPDYYMLGFYIETRLVGSLMAIVCDDLALGDQKFMVIENVVVAREFQGKGIGRKLMEYTESIARQRNCIFIQFCSSSFRSDAHAFYYSLGYTPDNVRGFRKFLMR